MSLRYCKKCSSILDDTQSLKKEGVFYCFRCRRKLIYFGAEAAKLSSSAALLEYDRLHPFKPVEDFSDTSYTDHHRLHYDSVSFLECEDFLRYNPNHKESLLFMARHYWSKRDLFNCKNYFKKILKQDRLTQEEASMYCDVLIADNDFQLIVDFLSAYKQEFSEYFIQHLLSIAYLGLGNYKPALSHFYKAYFLCKDVKRKKKIKEIIQHISTYLHS